MVWNTENQGTRLLALTLSGLPVWSLRVWVENVWICLRLSL